VLDHQETILIGKGEEDQIADSIHGFAISGTGATSRSRIVIVTCYWTHALQESPKLPHVTLVTACSNLRDDNKKKKEKFTEGTKPRQSSPSSRLTFGGFGIARAECASMNLPVGIEFDIDDEESALSLSPSFS